MLIGYIQWYLDLVNLVKEVVQFECVAMKLRYFLRSAGHVLVHPFKLTLKLFNAEMNTLNPLVQLCLLNQTKDRDS